MEFFLFLFCAESGRCGDVAALARWCEPVFLLFFQCGFFTLDFLDIFPGDYTHGIIAGGRAEDVAWIDGAVSSRVLRVAGHWRPFSWNCKSQTISSSSQKFKKKFKFFFFAFFFGRKFFSVRWFFFNFFHFGFPLMTQLDSPVLRVVPFTVRAWSPESMSSRPRSSSPCISPQISIGPLLRCADNRLIDWFCEDVTWIDGALSPRVLRVAGHWRPFSSNCKSQTISSSSQKWRGQKKSFAFFFGRKFSIRWFFFNFFRFGFPLNKSVQCFELFHCTVRARSPESMSPRPRSSSPCNSPQISIGPLLRCADNRLIDWFCAPNLVHSYSVATTSFCSIDCLIIHTSRKVKRVIDRYAEWKRIESWNSPRKRMFPNLPYKDG